MTLTDEEAEMVREALEAAQDDIYMEYGDWPSYRKCEAALSLLDAKANQGEG